VVGETCQLPFELGEGGLFEGDLGEASADVEARCLDGVPASDHVYRLRSAEGEGFASVHINTAGSAPRVTFTLVEGDCELGEGQDECWRGARSTQRGFDRGRDLYLLVHLPEEGREAGSRYQFSFAYGDGDGDEGEPGGEGCSVPDGDGDGRTLCDGDCDDRDPDDDGRACDQ
jgi:hypothetical protein